MQILKFLNTAKAFLNNINLHLCTKNYHICFFAGQLLLVTNRIVFFVDFGPFFDLVCPVASAKISQEEKKPMSEYQITCVYQKS